MKIKSHQTMTKHILNWYDKASALDLDSGLTWYEDVYDMVLNTLDYNSTSAHK